MGPEEELERGGAVLCADVQDNEIRAQEEYHFCGAQCSSLLSCNTAAKPPLTMEYAVRKSTCGPGKLTGLHCLEAAQKTIDCDFWDIYTSP